MTTLSIDNDNKMIIEATIFWLLLCFCHAKVRTRCLTGYMTDVQDWVTEDGELRMKKAPGVIDLSRRADALDELQRVLTIRRKDRESIRYLSLASCGFDAVPYIFKFRDRESRHLFDTLEYFSMYNNDFHKTSDPDFLYTAWFNATSSAVELEEHRGKNDDHYEIHQWASAFKEIPFHSLKELDLRSCCIRIIQTDTFKNMPKLEALYLGENNIVQIEHWAFNRLNNLIHLDISNNEVREHIADGISIDANIFEPLKTLSSLDLSNTKLTRANSGIFNSISSTNLSRVSICKTAMPLLFSTTFSNTNIKYLDISGNSEMMRSQNNKFIQNLASSLIVLYADTVGLLDLEIFKKFENLEILKVPNNGITYIPVHVTTTWKNMQILDFTGNRLPSWSESIYKNIPKLRYLSLIKNNLNMISDVMLEDIGNIQYIGMSNNYYVCSCQVRELMDLSSMVELNYGDDLRKLKSLRKVRNLDLQNNEDSSLHRAKNEQPLQNHKAIDYHTGFQDFNDIINARIPTTNTCCSGDNCVKGDTCGREIINYDLNASFVIFDYAEKSYTCTVVNENQKRRFPEVQKCRNAERSAPYEKLVEESIITIVLLTTVPLIVFLVIFIVFIRRWWCIKYFCITIKNSAMLSLIGDEEKNSGPEPIYHYDVFVSYCNDDRAWVLDQLLPQVEADCNVSVCLHERDFQVGISILENIVSCMDRSRAILLVLSLKFLQSQWCQFEMHLAQHRLIETRREDLILILLEEIPRHRRPKTLHYLMLTKTYIVWPETKTGQQQFWRRVKSSLTQQNSVVKNKDSFA